MEDMERGSEWRSARGGSRWEWGRMERGGRGAEDGEDGCWGETRLDAEDGGR